MFEDLLPAASTTRALEEVTGKGAKVAAGKERSTDRSQQATGADLVCKYDSKAGYQYREGCIHGSELVLHLRLECVFSLLVCLLKQVFGDR